jgi:ketosteroid isomerase-like protein
MGAPELDAVRRQHARYGARHQVLAEIYAPDVEWVAAREDPDAATHVGPDAIQAYFTQWVEPFEGVEFEVLEVLDGGDRIFTWLRFAGRGAGSGATVEMEHAEVWTFRDGLVVRVEEFYDHYEGLRAAGLADG